MCPLLGRAVGVGAVLGAFAIWATFGQNAVTLGMGQTALQ